jgi:hypothetical protein
MAQTLKNITDSIRLILTKMVPTDDSRLDPDYLAYKVNQVRAQLIASEYENTKVINPTWLSDLGLTTFYKTNFADDSSVSCSCSVSKTTLPQTLNLPSKDGNIDLGVFSIISPCGTKRYYYKRMSAWDYAPEGHTNRLFNYYDRVNNALYVNSDVTQLRILALLLNPQDGFIKNTDPIASGSIVSGTAYKVFDGTVVYANVFYNDGDTFTGGGTATYSGTGKVYLASQASDFADTDPYPASGDMIRQIELEILTKEFGIEMKMPADQRNDSRDDATKSA